MPIVLPLPGDVNGFKDGLTQPASCCSGATLASPGRVAGRARTLTLSWEHRLWPEPAAASVMAVVA
jgi:hypothetical protein